ncbi:MAG TPA: hypothetical protein VEJ63_11170 [Planctomycetota bacterium]|nr:hypothetical protein [Planctomycetota bacterium]
MADTNTDASVSKDSSAQRSEGPVLVGGSAQSAAGGSAAAAPFPKHLRPGRKWNLPQPSKYSTKKIWTLMALSSVAMALLWVSLAELLVPTVRSDGPPPMGKEFRDQENNFSIRPPLNWTIEDPHDGPNSTTCNVYIKGPAEKLFSPIVITSLEIAPGRLTTYVQEHKARMTVQDKSIEWIEEDEDVIDGCRAWKMVYDVTLPTDEKNEDGTTQTVKVRTLQYILDDHPRFYRVTCHVRADQYKRYLARFEACAHTFQRTPLVQIDVKRDIAPAADSK